jgi:hypothetical protein
MEGLMDRPLDVAARLEAEADMSEKGIEFMEDEELASETAADVQFRRNAARTIRELVLRSDTWQEMNEQAERERDEAREALRDMLEVAERERHGNSLPSEEWYLRRDAARAALGGDRG